eukprot:scaffold55989_cov69-Phaeocystis_antarctica.AAC.1
MFLAGRPYRPYICPQGIAQAQGGLQPPPGRYGLALPALYVHNRKAAAQRPRPIRPPAEIRPAIDRPSAGRPIASARQVWLGPTGTICPQGVAALPSPCRRATSRVSRSNLVRVRVK